MVGFNALKDYSLKKWTQKKKKGKKNTSTPKKRIQLTTPTDVNIFSTTALKISTRLLAFGEWI